MKYKIELCKEELLTKEYVQATICRSDNAVMRAAIFLYKKQTEYEKMTKQGQTINGIGFNRIDTPVISQFAEDCLKDKGAKVEYINKIRPRILKYCSQIAKLINDKKDIQYEWRT